MIYCQNYDKLRRCFWARFRPVAMVTKLVRTDGRISVRVLSVSNFQLTEMARLTFDLITVNDRDARLA